MKKLISILVCLLLVVSSVAVSAAILPETSAWAPRCRNFNGDHSANGWNPSFEEAGGIGMYVTDGNLDGGFDKFENYMSLSRTSETGELYWRDYVTGYTWAPYFVQLKLYKSEGAEAYIYNYGAGGDGFFDLKWAADGKLYAKYRDDASAPSDRTNYKYLCDINGDIAEIVIYYYSEDQYYHVSVNGEMVGTLLYSANADAVNVEQIRIGLSEGNVGDELQLDYFYAGDVKSSPIVPVSLTADTTNVETNGTVNVTYNFKGDGVVPGDVIYFAAFDGKSSELLSVDVVPVADNAQYTESGATVSGTVTVDPENYITNKIKAFIWDNNLAPVTAPKIVGLSPLPPAFSYIIRTDNFDNGVALADGNGQFYVYDTYGDGAQFTEENNKFNMIKGNGYCEATAYANGGSDYRKGLFKFTMSKSGKYVWGRVMGLNYFWLTMTSAGNVTANYRDAEGNEVIKEVVPNTDKTSFDVVVKFDGTQFSLWIDNTLVIDNQYSLSTGNMYQIRMTSEAGEPGDTVSISNYIVGLYD